MPKEENDTYIALYRKLLSHPIWTQHTPVHRDLWVAILLRVDYKTGTLKTSASVLAELVAYWTRGRYKIPSRKTILEVLRVFSAKQLIELSVKRDGIDITVTNWDTYQSKEDRCETQRKHGAKHRENTMYKKKYKEEVQEEEDMLRAGTRTGGAQTPPSMSPPPSENKQQQEQQQPEPQPEQPQYLPTAEPTPVDLVIRAFVTASGRTPFNGKSQAQIRVCREEIEGHIHRDGLESVTATIERICREHIQAGDPLVSIPAALWAYRTHVKERDVLIPNAGSRRLYKAGIGYVDEQR